MTRLYTLLLLSALALAEDPADLQIRKANIVSEGTRLSASLYSLKSLDGKKLPSIIMCHGWGGTAAGLRPQAMDFARAGYFVVVFDYRGWGDSDSRLILTKPAPEQRPDHRFTAEVQEVREVVDPIEQTTDLQNVVHWIQGEAQADPARIGLWGSSYSGGHVIYVAARDHRVKALVSQVGAADSRWVVATEQARSETYAAATKRARGETGRPDAPTNGERGTGGVPP